MTSARVRPSLPKSLFRFLAALAALFAVASSQAQERRAEYQLGAGDAIRVLVFQNPDLTTEARVTENGSITFPIVGAVHVGGLTIPAAEQAVAAALRAQKVIEAPQVNIVLLQNRGNQVSVLGAVARPGRFPLETLDIRVSEMIAVAGGITAGGSDVAVVTGMRDGKRFRREIDIPALFLDDRGEQDMVLAGGDVIFVNTRAMFYVYGEVQKPGAYRVERGMTIRQALAAGGGPTLRGTERALCLYRDGDKPGKRECKAPDMNDAVRNGDVLYVGESIF